MRSVALFLGFGALLGHAPLQCRAEPDPALRIEDTPEEALYALAVRFRSEGDVAAWRRTLEYLAERYPNSRYAVRAKDDLTGGTGAR